jgi:glycosyltransferase involved in cell wall biosynthesis
VLSGTRIGVVGFDRGYPCGVEAHGERALPHTDTEIVSDLYAPHFALKADGLGEKSQAGAAREEDPGRRSRRQGSPRRPLRVLACHVRYRQAGGEDAVFVSETAVLRAAGLDVATLDLSSSRLRELSAVDLARVGLFYSSNPLGRAAIRTAVREHRPDVVHFHNLYPLLGPGAVDEAHRLGCATVQTLHNTRVACLTGTNILRSQVCQLCEPAHFFNGVRRRCYRGSLLQSLLASRASTRQWRDFVERGRPDLWLALTPFMKEHLVRLGAPAERIVVKPNSVAAGSPIRRSLRAGVFCAGRLAPEKGHVQLMRAWPADAPELTVAGDGPLEKEAAAAARANVRYVGRLGQEEMRRRLRSALVVAIPSVWFEPITLVALEAFSEGTPVVAFRGWSLGSVVEDLSPGLVVPFADYAGLAARAVATCEGSGWDHASERCLRLWRQKYSHEVNGDNLVRAYDTALSLRGVVTREAG